MSTRITCSKCGATIIEHLLKPSEQSECPRCGQMNTVPNHSDTTDSSSSGPNANSKRRDGIPNCSP
ncbi:MAG: hypothetical protein IPH59_16075 [bacterium]|nr:hypothetical protein [bacterium]